MAWCSVKAQGQLYLYFYTMQRYVIYDSVTLVLQLELQEHGSIYNNTKTSVYGLIGYQRFIDDRRSGMWDTGRMYDSHATEKRAHAEFYLQ
jgi:hypothetical protein